MQITFWLNEFLLEQLRKAVHLMEDVRNDMNGGMALFPVCVHVSVPFFRCLTTTSLQCS